MCRSDRVGIEGLGTGDGEEYEAEHGQADKAEGAGNTPYQG